MDNLFKINVLHYSAAHGLPHDQNLQDNMAKAIESLRPKTVTLVPWNSETTSYDLTHVVFGKPVDAAADSESLTVYEFDAFLCADERKQSELVKQLVQICGGIQ